MTRTSVLNERSSGGVGGAAIAVSSQRLAWRLAILPLIIAVSVARRGDRPDHLRLLAPRIAVAMRQGAGKAETVAGDEQEGLAVDPELELAANDDAGLLAGVAVGAVARGGAGLEAAGQELERPGKGRAEQFVRDAGREIEAAATGAP